MKNLRFLSITAILIVIFATVIGSSIANAQSFCSPATAISVPYTFDGAGSFCWQAATMCNNINSWNLTFLAVNGVNYTNMWVSGPSIAPFNGTFGVVYNSDVSFGHFEIDGPCLPVTPMATSTRTNTPSGPTATGTGRSQTPITQPTRTWTPTGGVINTATRTSTPSFTPTITRTITPQSSTLTRTPTQGGPLSLKVQYMPGNANASSTSIQPMIRIVNTGSASVPLEDFAIQYWYTWEGATQSQTWTCISATIIGGCSNIVGDFAPLNPVRPGADFVLQNNFVIGVNQIAPGQSIDIQYRLTKSDSSLYTQTGDYSFNPNFTTYTDWPNITLFHWASGKAIWGVEPIRPTNTPTLTPTATLPGGICTPVEATLTAPFDFTGAGTHCWRSSSMNSFMSNNLRLLSINGMNLTNVFATAASLPPQINGYWYITFASDFNWGHFQIFD